jgi:hypothetical protein
MNEQPQEAMDQAQAEQGMREQFDEDRIMEDAMSTLEAEYLRILRAFYHHVEGVDDLTIKTLCYGLGVDFNRVKDEA